MQKQNKYHQPVVKGLRVEVHNNNIESALRKFKKKVQEDGVLQEVRNREYYEKPTTKRKRAKSAARARLIKKLNKENQEKS